MHFMDYYERPAVLTQVIAPTGGYQFNKVKSALTALRDTLVAQKAKRDLLEKQRVTAVTAKEDAETQLGIFDKVQILLQKTSDYARRQAKERIEAIVSEALNVVFGGSHRFAIELSLKSNQPVAEYFLNDGTVITKLEKPDYDRGGGKIDVITLALRLAIGEMEGIQGPLLLDEVGKHISREYTANVAYFLKEYGEQFNRQVVLITHNSDLAEIGDLGLAVTCRNGVSEVTTV